MPFPPPLHKAGLSVFPPLAEKGRFPPVIVVDRQAVRGPAVRTAKSPSERLVVRYHVWAGPGDLLSLNLSPVGLLQ